MYNFREPKLPTSEDLISETDTLNSYFEGGTVMPTRDGSISQSQTPNVNDFFVQI